VDGMNIMTTFFGSASFWINSTAYSIVLTVKFLFRKICSDDVESSAESRGGQDSIIIVLLALLLFSEFAAVSGASFLRVPALNLVSFSFAVEVRFAR
jgi:hypothetical protein